MNTYSINSNSSTKTLYTFQSDEIGNITNIGNVTVDWNGRRLESISQGGTVVVSYDYNIDGQRTKKTALDIETGEYVTTEFFYNGEILAGQKKGDDVIVFMYDNNGDIFGFEYNGTPYYYVKNAQNDVWLILDENGQAQVLYQYDAWGRVVYGLDATDFGLIAINPIMYRSYYVDLEMGMFMYYLNSRYYMADWGRFISADTTDILSVQSDLYDKNLFAYCDNNPVVRVDVSGYAWETVFDIASLCLSMAEVAVNPADAWAWIGLAADFVDLVPFVTGLGEIVRAVKVSNKAIDAVDTVSDATKAAKKATSALETVNYGKKVDFFVTPNGDAIPSNLWDFNINLSKMDNINGKYYGFDSRGPLRIRIEQHLPTANYSGPVNPYHCEPHFHIDRRLNGSSGNWNKNYTGLLGWLY